MVNQIPCHGIFAHTSQGCGIYLLGAFATVFIAEYLVYTWVYCPFGIKNWPAFQPLRMQLGHDLPKTPING
jgi:hypothetical protein